MRLKYAILLLVVVLLQGCGGEKSSPTKEDENSSTELSCQEQKVNIESQLTQTLQRVTTDSDFTLMMSSTKGAKNYNFSRGTSTEDTLYASASTSKLVSATVILDVVANSNLTLDSHPQDFISTWPTTGNLSEITLHDLLNFTSGLREEPFCLSALSLGTVGFEKCFEEIAPKNSAASKAGTEFYYGPVHLQVAGMMAIKASNKNSWKEVFDAFKAKYSLFATASYDLPSSDNPRLAGGMHYSAQEYKEFLDALYANKILSQENFSLMTKDQLGNATIVASPAQDGINEDWHYGYGLWIECHNSLFNCKNSVTRISSPGAFGAYPFIDFENGYYGILAREGAFATFTNGYKLFLEIEPIAKKWSTLECK